jgi:hypothetical protein
MLMLYNKEVSEGVEKEAREKNGREAGPST